jgi:hypothetical protein
VMVVTLTMRWVMWRSRADSLDPAYTGGCFTTQPNLVALNVTGRATFDNASVLGSFDALAKTFDGARMLFDQQVCLSGHQTHMCLGGGDKWRAVGPGGVNMVAPVWRCEQGRIINRRLFRPIC